ncbi:hypothetical protein DTO217A2_5248 [Paecilomyces variotii]|nr:hypothetical protein DTO217A2_5248 [Paecilomyces variotii]
MTSTETPAERALRLMKTEDVTNRVWNYLLSTAFTFPKFLVVPEYHFVTTAGAGDEGYADLAVLKVDGLGKNNHRIVLLYEGKKEGGDWAKIADTARQANRAMGGRKKGETPFIVIALGPYFGFLHHDLTNVDGFIRTGVKGKDYVTGLVDATDGKKDNFERIMQMLGEYANTF